ncbi:GntR family transcriptional regulator [Falsihalocynthiibacter sp. S25ZX9]|uniref:GntR family transcriptional regulator n=1 Tax=Falsihalocynthiibacter sp. S25ZX9 TaxID=3240870 RepID=UPI00350FCECC
MSRSNSVYKEAYNRCLDCIRDLDITSQLPPETELAKKLKTSRTTIRVVLEHLDQTKVIHWDGRLKTVLRMPAPIDYFAIEETRSASEKVDTLFMDYILGGDLAPGSVLRESELAREFGVSSSAIREYLIRFSRFGLIEKEPNRHWVLLGFTRDFAEELFDVREIFELRTLRNFCETPMSPESRAELQALEVAHVDLLENIDTHYLKFSRLDERFHRVLIEKLGNRFISDFYVLISLIFHFHYRWNKTYEKERNIQAAKEHLVVIRALLSGSKDAAKNGFTVHLKSARRTLLDSVVWD